MIIWNLEEWQKRAGRDGTEHGRPKDWHSFGEAHARPSRRPPPMTMRARPESDQG